MLPQDWHRQLFHQGQSHPRTDRMVLQRRNPIEIQQRIEYLLANKKIQDEKEFLIMDMMKTANQCVGRCMRGKKDKVESEQGFKVRGEGQTELNELGK